MTDSTPPASGINAAKHYPNCNVFTCMLCGLGPDADTHAAFQPLCDFRPHDCDCEPQNLSGDLNFKDTLKETGGNQAATQSSGDNHGSAAHEQHTPDLSGRARARVIAASGDDFAPGALAAAREALIITRERVDLSDMPTPSLACARHILTTLVAELTSTAQEQTDGEGNSAVVDRAVGVVGDGSRTSDVAPQAVALPTEIETLLKEANEVASNARGRVGWPWAGLVIERLATALRAEATARQQAEQRAKILDGIIARTLHTLGADEWETADGLALLRMAELRKAKLRAEQAEQALERLRFLESQRQAFEDKAMSRITELEAQLRQAEQARDALTAELGR